MKKNKELKEPIKTVSALDVARYLLSLDPKRKYFTLQDGNFRLNIMLHIMQILHCAKYKKLLFYEDMIAYPPSWHKLSLKDQNKLATIYHNKKLTNKKEAIQELYKKAGLEHELEKYE